VQRLCAPFVPPVAEHAQQPEDMIAVEVAYENMLAGIGFEPVTKNLHLCAFTAVNQKPVIAHPQQLRRVVPTLKRPARRIAKDGELHGAEIAGY
jgi:hypothetical protein